MPIAVTTNARIRTSLDVAAEDTRATRLSAIGTEVEMPDRWVTFDCYGTIVDWNATLADALTGLFDGDDARERSSAEFHDAERRIKHGDGYQPLPRHPGRPASATWRRPAAAS